MDHNFEFLYSKKVMNHFLHPKNMGVIENPDGQATIGNPVCGDVMKFYIKVGKKKNKEYLKNVKFQTLGCAAAIATSSIMTVLVKGKPLDDAVKIGKKAIIDSLGGLPKNKIHCSVLADTALKKAIINYRKKKKL